MFAKMFLKERGKLERLNTMISGHVSYTAESLQRLNELHKRALDNITEENINTKKHDGVIIKDCPYCGSFYDGTRNVGRVVVSLNAISSDVSPTKHVCCTKCGC